MGSVAAATLEAGDRIEVRLLGPLQVRRADGSLVDPKEWRTGKTADLLRLLALRAGQPVSVASLLDALWPTVDEQRGRASLRTAASLIRRVIGQDCVERRLGGLALRDVWVDAVAFSALAADARRARRDGQLARSLTVTREAESLYLDELQAHDAGAEWLIRERESLASLYRGLLADAADSAVELGWMRDAVEFATRSLGADPCSERAYRALMQGYAGLGETERALREYENCRTVLADELGADPSAQTRALHIQLLSVEPVVHTTPPFLGRDAERQWLRSVVREALENRQPALVYLTGEAEVGKARLVAEALREFPGRTVKLSCAGAAAEGEADLVELVLTGLTTEQPGADRTDGAERGALTGLLRRAMGEGGPLAISVEEVHLAGPDALGELAGALADLDAAVAVVLTADCGRDRAAVAYEKLQPADSAGQARLKWLHVPPLVGEEVAELAEALLAGPPTRELVAELVQESGGRPGRVASILRDWSRGGRVAATAAGLTLMPARDPSGSDPGMRPLLARALEQLPSVEHEVLHVAAVLTGTVTPALLAPLLGDDEEQEPGGEVARLRVQAVLDRLVDLSVLRAEPAGYAFRHPLLKDAVHSWLRPSARRRLHRRVAERAVIAAADRIQHWLAAHEPQLACAAALDASVQAMADGRYEDARAHLMEVCSLGDLPESDPSDRVGLFERLGDACAMLGRRGEARAAFAVAAKVSRAHGLPDLPRITAKCDTVSAPDWVAERSPARALRPSAPARNLAARLGIDATTPPGIEVEELLREALDDADRRNDPAERAEARLLLSRVVCIPRRQLGQSRQWTQEALSLVVDPAVRALALADVHLPDVLQGNAGLVEAPLRQARALAEESGEGRVERRVDLLRCLAAHDLGSADFDALWAELSAARSGGETDVDPELGWVAVRILTERGQLAAAQEVARQPVPTDVGPRTDQLRLLATASLHSELGEREEAVTLLQAAVDLGTSGGCTLLLPEAAARLVVLESDVDLDAAHEHFELFDWAVGAETGLPREGSWRLLARAAVRAAHGQYDRAASAAANAADLTERRGLLFLAAKAHTARAGYLAAAGWPSEARLATAAAARCYRTAGAAALARRVEAVAPARPLAATTAQVLDLVHPRRATDGRHPLLRGGVDRTADRGWETGHR